MNKKTSLLEIAASNRAQSFASPASSASASPLVEPRLRKLAPRPSLFEDNSAPSPVPNPRKRAAPHSDIPPVDLSPSPEPQFGNLTPQPEIEDTKTTGQANMEKQIQYRAEREPQAHRSVEHKVQMTLAEYRQSFQDLLTHIRAPRKNGHNKKRPNEHMFTIKLSPQLELVAAGQGHPGLCMKNVCSTLTGEDMRDWAMEMLMGVMKNDGLSWGNLTVNWIEGGAIGKASNWEVNGRCPHGLESCLANTNVEIQFCTKTRSALITYHHQWQCVSLFCF
jgi:hypothetical protein